MYKQALDVQGHSKCYVAHANYEILSKSLDPTVQYVLSEYIPNPFRARVIANPFYLLNIDTQSLYNVRIN
jgi:hypothetical protein